MPDGVERIAGKAFAGCSSLTSVVIPNSVLEIGFGNNWSDSLVFSGCVGLTSISIPNSVRRIGNSAFLKCSNLKFVEMSDEVEEIGRSVFDKCKQLLNPVFSKHIFIKLPETHEGSYEIPFGIEKIEDGAFSNCESLTSVEIPNSVVEIGYSAFENCTSLATIEIPNSVRVIEYGAFNNCSSLTSINIPNGLKEIGTIFEKCKSLKLIYISKSFEYIHSHNIKDKGPKLKFVVDKNNKDYCDVNGTLYSKDMWWLYHFYGGKTDYFSVPNSVYRIMEYAFEWSKINEVEIGDSVEEIMEGAFWDSRINKILLSHNIKKIGKQAFVKCTVKELHMRHERPEQIDVAEDAFEQCAEKCTLYVPVGTGYAYRHHPVFGKFKDVIIEQ